MSDLLKAKDSPQFNWYTTWTSLGADGLPNNLIEEGMKQPDTIKVQYKTGTKEKEHSAYVVPDQALFGPEYFITYTRPAFQEIVNRLPDDDKKNAVMLFDIMGQCFRGTGKTEWNNVVSKRCPTDADKSPDKLEECQRDYLEAVAGFPNVGDQLIRWFQTAKKPALMPFKEYMRRRVQLFSYLDSGLLRTTMAKPTDQEKVEQIFLGQPKNHQVKYAINNKTVSTNTADLQAFFEQCQAADKSSGKLDQIKKDKDESKKKTERGTARRSAHSDRDSHRNARHYHDGDRDNHGRR